MLLCFCFFLGLTDVYCDDYYVPGGLVSILYCMSLGIIWWPQDDPSSYGYHCTTLCQVFNFLQPLHLCYCKQKVSLFMDEYFTHFTQYTHVSYQIIIKSINRTIFSRFRRAIIGMIRCQTRQQITINTEIPMAASQQTLTHWDGKASVSNYIDVPWEYNY